ncbi:MAG: MerR family transcriptional regulator [Caulobacteraceae bacterium]|nr:MerR family transcriptional regulator [Caulobacteraceae bacterium]
MAKGPEAFRTISEAADEVGVAQHVLRFWETKFSFLRPMKRAGGRRFYRPQDIAQLKAVRILLHERGMAIKGVQQLHRLHGLKAVLSVAEEGGSAPPGRRVESGPSLDALTRLSETLAMAKAAKAALDALLENQV